MILNCENITFGPYAPKESLWTLGGKPVICTDNVNDSTWPVTELYRLVSTDMHYNRQRVDWTHEREWRLKGDLFLNLVGYYPIVSDVLHAQLLYSYFLNISHVYVVEQQLLYDRWGGWWNLPNPLVSG